ncbi:hypothetical protein Acr_25g0003030 [Actinidia rufa]|uniref:Uncharacterized protein n=1 Tax=Actinidia rufa TaxID=165716 RepID=A0A7J0GZD8_9ERIC|nr:hypothetical protein Acr_25g0003030 [Actinidia rufa]
MASQSSNRSGSQGTPRETPHAPKTPGGVDRWDITMQPLQSQLTKMAQFLVDNRLMKSVPASEAGQSEDRIKGLALLPREVRIEGNAGPMNLCEMLNAKQNRDCDLCTKLNGQKVLASSKVIPPTGLIARTVRPEQREKIPKYPTSFSREIERMDPPEKFTPLRFTHEPRKTNDGPLEPYGCPDVSGVPI